MSDKYLPYHLRDINNPPNYLDEQQRKNWIHAAVKAKKNYQLQQEYPPFIIPTSIYQVIHVHKNTTMETMQMLVEHVQNCQEYTIDTESEKLNQRLSLIQIQSIPRQLPLFVILLELAHLLPVESEIQVKIELFLQLIFRSGNKLYSWGPLDRELSSFNLFNFIDWPIRASMIDIQCEFPGWYTWALSHCEVCDPSRRQNVSIDDIVGNVNLSYICNCHEPSTYRFNEKWSLQQALKCSYHIFIDKSVTISHWSNMLDPVYSTLTTTKRDRMIRYAIYDCFATTMLIKPVIQFWSFQKLINIDVSELFTSSSTSSRTTISNNVNSVHNNINRNNTINNINTKKIKTNIDVQTLLQVLDDDIELISEEDDDDLMVSRCILSSVNHDLDDAQNSNGDNRELNGNVLVNDVELIIGEENDMFIDDNEDKATSLTEHVQHMIEKDQPYKTVKRACINQKRSIEARHRRNQRKNRSHRLKRYRYFVSRPVYPRYTMLSIRKILHDYDINYVHVKIKDGLLIIGVKDSASQQRGEQQLPEDIFDRRHYQSNCRRSRRQI